MGFLLTQALTALASASSLFLVAAGLTVIFGVTRVVNFAQGSLTMLGAYIAWTILRHLPRDPASFALGVLATTLALAVLGALLEMTLLRRIYRAPELFQLLATFGVVLMVQDVTLKIWGPDDLSLPRPPWMRGFVTLLGERFPLYDLYLIAAGPIVLGLIWLLLHRTRWGRLVRAATQDREMVACLGVDQSALFTAVFALGSALAGLAGALALPDGSANLGIDLSVVTEAFVVVVVGGMGSVPGAYLASLLIAALQAAGIVVLPKITLRPGLPGDGGRTDRAAKRFAWPPRGRRRGAGGAGGHSPVPPGSALDRDGPVAVVCPCAADRAALDVDHRHGGGGRHAVCRQSALHDGAGRDAQLRPCRVVRDRGLCRGAGSQRVGRADAARPCGCADGGRVGRGVVRRLRGPALGDLPWPC